MRTQIIRVSAIGLAAVAVLIGAIAIFTSGYTAGNYVHDLVLLVLALAVLAVAGDMTLTTKTKGPDDDTR